MQNPPREWIPAVIHPGCHVFFTLASSAPPRRWPHLSASVGTIPTVENSCSCFLFLFFSRKCHLTLKTCKYNISINLNQFWARGCARSAAPSSFSDVDPLSVAASPTSSPSSRAPSPSATARGEPPFFGTLFPRPFPLLCVIAVERHGRLRLQVVFFFRSAVATV